MSSFVKSNSIIVNNFVRFRHIHTSLKGWAKAATENIQKPKKDKIVLPEEKKKVEPEKKLTDNEALNLVRISTSADTDCSKAKVVIVGAGIAGIAAAKYFEVNGVKSYTILEALERPGGRIHSDWFGDAVIEYGSDCFNPTTHTSSFLQVALQDGIIEPPISYTSLFRTNDCQNLNDPISLAAYEIFKKLYCEFLYTGGDMLQHFSFRVDQELETFPDHLKDNIARIIIGLLALIYRRQGDNLQLIRRGNFGTYLQIPNGKTRLHLGMSGTLSTMLRTIPRAKILYNKPVQNIRWGAVECENYTRMMVKCCDGSVHAADYVLVTVSLGVLKQMASTLFCPALPSSTMEAIEKIDYQHRNHIFFRFKHPKWMWYNNVDCIPKWDPNWDKQFEKDTWLRSITEIKPVYGSETLLQVVVEGNLAQLAEKCSKLDLARDLNKYLKHVHKMDRIPPITDVRRSEWSRNIYFNGAYPFLPPNVSPEFHTKLACALPGDNAPVTPMIFFAGDATCPKPPNLVQGARISGLREAIQIHNLIKTSLQNASVNYGS